MADPLGNVPIGGSVRKSGTTVVIEDVAFPVEALADAAQGLTELFRRHSYDNAIIFGHAKDGNLHFVITQGFNDQAAIDQYAFFIDDVVKLVVERFDGAVKAEHGTGRNMAPFVETEWGPEAYEIMRRLKELADPDNLLNPGVIINPDHRAHLANLKRLPSVEPEIDKCIECGFCEPKCPSRELTLTPRQRIVVRREMARLVDERKNTELYDALNREFPYMALDTCATDGLCATACPVSIDTGQLVKRFRNLRSSSGAHEWAARIAKNFAATERVLRTALRLGHTAQGLIGVEGMRSLTKTMKRFMGENMSEWMPDTPYAAGAVPSTQKARASAVIFPLLYLTRDGPFARRTQRSLADGGDGGPGQPCRTPCIFRPTLPGHAVARHSRRRASPARMPSPSITRSSGSGAGRSREDCLSWWTPVLVPTPSKAARSYLTEENQERFDKMKFLDSIEWTYEELLPKLPIKRKAHSVALHPVCSVTKMGICRQTGSYREGLQRASHGTRKRGLLRLRR